MALAPPVLSRILKGVGFFGPLLGGLTKSTWNLEFAFQGFALEGSPNQLGTYSLPARACLGGLTESTWNLQFACQGFALEA